MSISIFNKKRVTLSNSTVLMHEVSKKVMNFLWKGQGCRTIHLSGTFEKFKDKKSSPWVWGAVTSKILTVSKDSLTIPLEAVLSFRIDHNEVNGHQYWTPSSMIEVETRGVKFLLSLSSDGKLSAKEERDQSILDSVLVRVC